MTDHTVTIGNSFLSDDYEVTCTCGFEVTLGTHEAAVDTANWHQGKPSLLGDVSGVAWQESDAVTSDPFCGGCGAPCGVACDPDCGADMDGKGQGAVLLLAVHIPGAEVDDDADIYAHELVEMVNEIRRDIGGGFADVTLSGYPAVSWITESPA